MNRPARSPSAHSEPGIPGLPHLGTQSSQAAQPWPGPGPPAGGPSARGSGSGDPGQALAGALRQVGTPFYKLRKPKPREVMGLAQSHPGPWWSCNALHPSCPGGGAAARKPRALCEPGPRRPVWNSGWTPGSGVLLAVGGSGSEAQLGGESSSTKAWRGSRRSEPLCAGAWTAGQASYCVRTTPPPGLSWSAGLRNERAGTGKEMVNR